MTEEEAKTKGCCGPNPAGVYRDELDPHTRYCEGSACMAWRWTGDIPERHPDQVSVHDGYCGLAGKP